MEHFEKKGYISSKGKMKDTMKAALQTGTLDLPQKYEAARERFERIIANADRRPPIHDLRVMWWYASTSRLCYRRNFWSYGIKSSRKLLIGSI